MARERRGEQVYVNRYALELSGLRIHRFMRDGAWFDYIFANRRGQACHFFLVGIYCAQ